MAAIAGSVGSRRYSLRSGRVELVTFDVPLHIVAKNRGVVDGEARVDIGIDEQRHTAALAAELRHLADRLTPDA